MEQVRAARNNVNSLFVLAQVFQGLGEGARAKQLEDRQSHLSGVTRFLRVVFVVDVFTIVAAPDRVHAFPVPFP